MTSYDHTLSDAERYGFVRTCVSLWPEDLERMERLLKRDRLDGIAPAACNQSALIRRALEFYERFLNPHGTVRVANPPAGKGQCATCGALVRFESPGTLREHSEGMAGLSAVRGKPCVGRVPVPVSTPPEAA